jgi:hypothetical protein
MTVGKCIFFCFLFFLNITCAFSQSRDSLLRLYNAGTISRYGTNFIKGDQRLRFNDLSNEFSFSPMALVGYELAKKNRTKATVLRVLSVAASVATISLISRENRTVTYAAWAGQIGLSLVGFYYQDRSNKLLDQALWQRNKDLLFGL